MGDRYALDTPENVTITYDVAGLGSRFIATLIDTTLLLLVVTALFIVTVVASSLSSGTSALASAIGILIINAVLLGYYIFFELLWNGQSPGKRALKLRVIGINGYPVTPLAVVIRNVLRLIDLLPGIYAIGAIVMIVTVRSRRLGDLAAGTLVIKEGRVPVQPTDRPYHSASLPTSLPYPSISIVPHTVDDADPTRLTSADLALLRDFMERRAALPRERRAALAAQLAVLIQQRVGGSGDLPSEEYLEALLQLYNARGHSTA